jgi:REP-associated tyrosine transposase
MTPLFVSLQRASDQQARRAVTTVAVGDNPRYERARERLISRWNRVAVTQVFGSSSTSSMANTYTQILYHIVFSTKERASVLEEKRREELFRYIWGIHQELNCHLYRVNAMEEHVHILMALHPGLSLADYIRELKTGTSRWISKEGIFPGFSGWQDGYAAFTVSIHEKDAVIRYIKDQQVHHQRTDYLDEYRSMLNQAKIKYDEQYIA